MPYHRKYPTKQKTTTLEGKREYQCFYMRERRRRKRAKIVELKHLASQPLTITRASELVEKIKQL